MAVSVAGGKPCPRKFDVKRSGPVLLFPAEDSLAVVRQRLEGISTAAGLKLVDLPIEVITAPSLRLDLEQDCQRLAELSDQGLVSHDAKGYQPRLNFEDPLVSPPPPIHPRGKGNGKPLPCSAAG